MPVPVVDNQRERILFYLRATVGDPNNDDHQKIEHKSRDRHNDKKQILFDHPLERKNLSDLIFLLSVNILNPVEASTPTTDPILTVEFRAG